MAPNGMLADGSNAPQISYDHQAGLEVAYSDEKGVVGPHQNEWTFCGIRRPKRFWLLALFGLIIVMAAALAGGLGGALANRDSGDDASSTSANSEEANNERDGGDSASSSSSSSTPTATRAANPTNTSTSTENSRPRVSETETDGSSEPEQFFLGCTGDERREYTPLNPEDGNEPFVVDGETQEFEILCDINYASHTSGFNPQITELQRILNVDSMEDCITLCAVYNSQLPPDPAREDMCSHAIYAVEDRNTTSWCYIQSGSTNGALDIKPSVGKATAVLL